MAASYKGIQRDGAEELVRDLSPTNSRYAEGEWIFRGQSQDLPLLPTAFRQERMKPQPKRPWEKWSNVMQARSELRLIRRFYDTADQAGLPIPEDSYDVRELLRELGGGKSGCPGQGMAAGPPVVTDRSRSTPRGTDPVP